MPPDTGIVHQVNVEYLARVVFREVSGGKRPRVSRTRSSAPTRTRRWSTGSACSGWGVGGIEAEAAMLGQPMSMLIPPVLGFKLTGAMPEGATATDLVLMVTERLRKHGVVGKFVEFFGPGLANLTIADRATLGNMCPEYGATAAMFPIDEMTLDYLTLTGRAAVAREARRSVREGAGTVPRSGDPRRCTTKRSSSISRSSSRASPGPKRPQDRVSLTKAKTGFQTSLPSMMAEKKAKAAPASSGAAVAVLEPPAQVRRRP